MMNWKRYARIAASTFVLGMTVVLATNAVVDPDGLIDWIEVRGFNETKTRIGPDSRLRKANQLANRYYNGVVLGTSRVGFAIDPRSAEIKRTEARRTFNAGLEGASMLEIERVAAHADKYQKLQIALIGLDFISFTERRTFPLAFEHSRFSSDRARWARPAYLLSVNAFLRSLGTVRDNLGEPALGAARFGFGREGDRRSLDHAAAFDRVLEESYLIEETAYAGFVYGERQLEAFARMLKKLAVSEARIEVFFTPLHARQMEAIHALGLGPTWERWRHDVADVVAEAQSLREGRIGFWDFAGYSESHTEPVPPRGSGEAMRWWFESAHFTPELGGRIVAMMLEPRRQKGQEGQNGTERFGTRIGAASLEQRHRTLRAAREEWLRTSPGEAQWVEVLVERTRRQRAEIPAWPGE